ncbi:MAG TPA: EamA family transporter RarD [Thermomicrobiales bacterium]|nr:EamA family transporter RarD [Thermomicrobiales bacterium]
MGRGVFASVLASVLFAGLYYYATLLTPLTGEEIFGWRLVFTAPGATVLLLATREWAQVRITLRRVREQPLLMLIYVANAAMLGVQMWVFMWAPLHGRAMQVTLGYFLMPLILVLIGRVLYRDSISRGQMLATACALVGVTSEFLRVGGLPWPTVLVSLGYPAYFVCRRHFRIDHHGDSWLELHLLIPAAVLFVLNGPTGLGGLPDHSHLLALIPGLGLISALAFSLYFFAMRTLNFSLFGLLGYVEPVLLVFVAFLLGERLSGRELMTYVPIWLAVGVLVAEGAWRVTHLRKRHAVPVTDPVVG